LYLSGRMPREPLVNGGCNLDGLPIGLSLNPAKSWDTTKGE